MKTKVILYLSIQTFTNVDVRVLKSLIISDLIE
jgi:hypothetical protein